MKPIVKEVCKKHGIWFKVQDEEATCPMCGEEGE